MKIKYLEIQAFGPFGKLEQIDFKKINQKQLFLITGNTGAGKTTIFDSVCFALYGETSGSTRSEPENLRSHFADEELDTYVKLTFEVRNETYEIIRYPKQQRYSKRTKGLVSKNQVAELKCLTGESKVYTKIQEVNQEINHILGLTADQFKQIVMLPQGEFQKLLISKSEEKQAIFRKIFQTEPYELFQNILLAKSQEAFKKIEKDLAQLELLRAQLNVFDEDLTNEINNKEFPYDELITHLESYILNENQVLKEKENTVFQLEKKLNETKDNYQKAVRHNEDLKMYLGLEEAIKLLEKETPQINELKQQVSSYEKARTELITYETYTRTDKEINKLSKDLKATLDKKVLINENYKEALINNEKLIPLENKKEILILELQTYDLQKKAYNELKQDIKIEKELNERLTKEQTNNLKAIENLELIKRQIKDNEILKEEKEKDVSNLSTLYEKIQIDKEVLRNLESDFKMYQDYESLKESTKDSLLKITQYKQTFTSIRHDYEVTKDKYHHSLVLVLRNELKENEPCPVCGSKEHYVSDSVLNDVLPTKELLLAKENNYLNSLKILERLESVFNEKTERLAHLEKELKPNSSELNELIINQKKVIERLSKDIHNLEQKKIEIVSLTSLISNQIKALEETKDQIHQNELNIRTTLEQINQLQVSILEKKNNLPYQEEHMLEEKIINHQKDLLDTKKMIESITKQYNEISLMKEKNKTQLDTLEENLLKTKRDHEQASNKLFNYLNEEGISLDEFVGIISDINIKEKKEHISQYERKYIELKSKQDTLKAQLDSFDYVDLFSKKELLENEEQSYKEALAHLKQYQFNLEETKKKSNHLKEVYLAYESLYKAYDRLKRLSDLSRGLSYNKVSFERYVLSYFFDQILRKANTKLGFMSSNRYLLKRKEDKSKGNQTSGLDLQVYDRNTTKLRDVETLSGGEIFKASLSLALGLAEVIKETSGGIELDTMFVDEGFGTLDDQSLDQAIDVLTSLNEEGRIVGLISHVGDLKRVIETQIEIEVTKSGSTIKKGESHENLY